MQTYRALKNQILKDQRAKREYDNLETEYALISQVLEARIQKGLSQAALAQKIGTKQSAISRFESGNYNPSLAFLRKISKALSTKLEVCIG